MDETPDAPPPKRNRLQTLALWIIAVALVANASISYLRWDSESDGKALDFDRGSKRLDLYEDGKALDFDRRSKRLDLYKDGKALDSDD